MNPDCHFGDHDWKGTSQCVHCGVRLRCQCGVYVREDNNTHDSRCRWLQAALRHERREIEAMFP